MSKDTTDGMDGNEFFTQLSRLIHRGYDEDVPMTAIYGSLGLARTKMENDLTTALGEERDLTDSDNSFRLGEDEELF